MSKYQEALSRIIDEYIHIHYEGKPMNQQTEDALLLQELVDNAYISEILDDLYEDMLEAVKEGYKRSLYLDTETFEGGKFQAYRYVLDFIETRLKENDLKRSDEQ